MSPATVPGESSAVLAELLPDEPGWIDLRGLLLTGRCEVWAEAAPADGLVARSWDFPFAALFGRPRPELITAATVAGRAACAGNHPADEWQLLAPPAARGLVKSALSGWRRQGIALYRWGSGPGGLIEDRGESPDAGAEILLLPEGHREVGLDLEEVPESSRREYELDWVSRRPMAVAMVAGRPVSFCYAAFTTASLWDVSVETLAPYRRRGLAEACFRAVAAHMARGGLTPAWGAMLDNPASMGLATKLGFVRDADLDGWFASR